MNLNEDTICKRLLAVNQTQEAVQTCSKWMLHHREAIDRIASCWISIYKKASDKLRIALIYVLNDVIQKAANKHDTNVTLALHPHWINATAMSSVSVKKAISRCVEVLQQRNVYPLHIIEEMKAVLVSRIATDKDESQNGEIDFSNLIRSIENFYKNEVLTEKAREILSRSSFNFKESVQARVKDRTEGTKALAEMDASRQKMFSFLESVERHQQKGLKLMEIVQQAKQSFILQLRDVTVVNDAYEKFAEGIRETKQQLDALEKSGALTNVGVSPPRDAPSPTAGDDPFAHGVDGEEAEGAEDMDMDEEDVPGPSSCFLKPSKDYVASIPSIPELDPRLQRLVNSSINHQFASNGSNSTAIVNSTAPLDPRQLDPRQARFFPPPQQSPPQPPPQMNFPSLTVPPPGLSPPSLSSNSILNNAGTMINIDTSQPPPQIFPVNSQNFSLDNNIPPKRASSAQCEASLSPPMPLFNPSNPPPLFNMLPSQQNLNYPVRHFMPPPTFSGQFPPPTSTMHFAGQKRRNSAESGANHKQRRPDWNRNEHSESRWRNDNGGGLRGRNWRRSLTGEGLARYRH